MDNTNDKIRAALESCQTGGYTDIDGDRVKTYSFDEKLVAEALASIDAAPAPAAGAGSIDTLPTYTFGDGAVYYRKDQADQHVAAAVAEAEQRRHAADESLRNIRAGHTTTVEYDLSPAMVESVLRDKLVELGWTPPRISSAPVDAYELIGYISSLGATYLSHVSSGGELHGPVYGARRGPTPDTVGIYVRQDAAPVSAAPADVQEAFLQWWGEEPTNPTPAHNSMAYWAQEAFKAGAEFASPPPSAGASTDNLQRAAAITATWPEWKRDYKLTKHSDAAGAPVSAAEQPDDGLGLALCVVKRPGMAPTIKRPYGDMAAYIRELYKHSHDADVTLVRSWSDSVGCQSAEDGREYLRMLDDGLPIPPQRCAQPARQQEAEQESEIILAAERRAEMYEDDDRQDIKTDVINAFYAGAQWQAKTAAQPVAHAPADGQELPALPEKGHSWWSSSSVENGSKQQLYTADQMQDYGRACRALGRGDAVRDYVAMRQPQGEAPPTWQPLTKPGQIQKGDKLRFTCGGKEYTATARLILEPGTGKEEVVYNIRQNFYFITSMAIKGTSSHTNVEFIAAKQAGKEGA